MNRDVAYRLARIYGGQLKTWYGKYKALVDCDVGDFVDGAAFLVESKEEEDALRYYETKNYEVVRCVTVWLEGDYVGQRAYGLTFRFAGRNGELTWRMRSQKIDT